MKLILSVLVFALYSPCYGQTFGLGFDERCDMEAGVISGETFGLDAECVPEPILVPRASPKPIAPRIENQPYSSPSGRHRHITVDGRVIEHGDWNFGDAVAHSDVARPWVKYYGPVPPSGAVRSSGCPGGVCPPNNSGRSSGPVRRLFR